MAERSHRYVQLILGHEEPCSYDLTDIGSITILWSQPVTALQIMSPEGKWRYAKHIPNGLVGIPLMLRVVSRIL